MKSWVLVLGLVGTSVHASAATNWVHAGTDTSGGGKAVACRGADGTLQLVEMLDLFEARAMYGLQPLAFPGELGAALEQAKTRFETTGSDNAASITPEIDRLKRRLRILPPGTRIEPVDDASPIVLPEGCRLEQAAVWVDRATVVADRELWEAMDVRNQAALIAHEVIYSFTRIMEGEKNSRRARKVVGYVFSQYEFEGIRAGVPDGSPVCITSSEDPALDSMFWIYPNERGELIAQFQVLRGQYLYGKTSATFAGTRFRAEEQINSAVDIRELESSFETPSTFVLMTTPKPEGGRSIHVQEKNAKGIWMHIPVSCMSPFQRP